MQTFFQIVALLVCHLSSVIWTSKLAFVETLSLNQLATGQSSSNAVASYNIAILFLPLPFIVGFLISHPEMPLLVFGRYLCPLQLDFHLLKSKVGVLSSIQHTISWYPAIAVKHKYTILILANAELGTMAQLSPAC